MINDNIDEKQLMGDLKRILQHMNEIASQYRAETIQAEQETERHLEKEKELQTKVALWEKRCNELIYKADVEKKELVVDFTKQLKAAQDESWKKTRDFRDKMSAVTALYQDLEESKRKLDKTQKEYEEDRNKFNEKKERFDKEKDDFHHQMEADRGKIQSYDRYAEENVKLKKSNADLQSKVNEISKSNQEQERDLEEWKKKYNEAENQRKTYQLKRDEARDEISKLQKELDVVKGRRESNPTSSSVCMPQQKGVSISDDSADDDRNRPIDDKPQGE